MLDWIFEGIIDWIAGIVTDLMDAVSGLFLNALGTDMTVMEVYFPFVRTAFTIMQYLAWSVLALVTIWQLFRALAGPVTDAENPWTLLARAVIFAFMIWFAKPVFLYVLEIAKAPYDALMEVSLGKEDFTFSGIESALQSGLVTIVSTSTAVGSLLLIILMLTLGWNYFKLLLEVVERYIVVGVLCYTSPLAYSMGASKATSQVFGSWCRMVGSQLLLLVMNVWFLRGFNSSVGQFIGNGGALPNGFGNIFLWLFCAIAFLKTAQRFDSHLSSIGLSVAQTGTGLGMEVLAVTRMLGGIGGAKTAGSVFGGAPSGVSPLDKFRGNSYVRDAVVQGGARMGAGGPVGLVGRMFGGFAAKNGASLSPRSVASVASNASERAGVITGGIADRSLGGFLPHLKGSTLSDTEISGGHIRTTATDESGNTRQLELFGVSAYDRPDAPFAQVEASDGSVWYQMTNSESTPPDFKEGDAAANCALARAFFPDHMGEVCGVDASRASDGAFEVRHDDGSATMFFDAARYEVPRGAYETHTDINGGVWYAVRGEASAERRPVYEEGKPVYDGESVRTVTVESVRYQNAPSKIKGSDARERGERRAPRRKK